MAAGGLYVRYLKPKPFVGVELIETIEDTCCAHVKLGPLHPLATIDISGADFTCIPTTTFVGITVAYDWIWKARGCAHNMLVALHNRQLLPDLSTPDVRLISWAEAVRLFMLYEQWTLVGDFRDITDADIEAFLSRYPKGRRAVIARAIATRYEASVDTKTRAFLKANEWNVAKDEDKMAPRCISSKTLEYLIDSIDFWVWTKENIHIWHDDTYNARYTYASGMTDVQVGEWVNTRVQQGCHIYEGDFSRFDGRNEIEAIKTEIYLYKTKAVNGALMEVLESQIECGGYSSHGIKYSCPGKVCSGVNNTSKGNSLRSFIIITYVLKYVIDWWVLVNGDDNLIATLLPLNLDLVRIHALEMGHKLEIVERLFPREIEFCSMRFYQTTEDSLVPVPKLGRFLAKSLMPHRQMLKKHVSSHMRQVVVGFSAYRQMPVFHTLMKQFGILKFCPTEEQEWQVKRTYFSLDESAMCEQIYEIYGYSFEEITAAMEKYDWTKPGQSIHDPVLSHLCLIDGVFDDESHARQLRSSC